MFSWTVALALMAPGVLHAQLAAVSAQHEVNSYTPSLQRCPAVAGRSDGSFVVVWDSLGSAGLDASGYSVAGRLVDPDGVPMGTQFAVNSYTPGTQNLADVAVRTDGSFVVVWQGMVAGDPDGLGIGGRRFQSTGYPVGQDFMVNERTSSFQLDPDIAFDSSGSGVVVWDSGDGSSTGIAARRLGPSGSPVGEEFQVNDGTELTQTRGSVSLDSSDRGIAMWHGSVGEVSNVQIHGRALSPVGTPTGDDIPLSETSVGTFPAAVMLSAHSFAVAWESLDLDPDGTGIFARWSRTDGLTLSDPVQVNQSTLGDQDRPQVALGPGGIVVVAWASDEAASRRGGDPATQDIAARSLLRGEPLGNEILVNAYATGDQRAPSVAAGADGAFLVVRESSGSAAGDSDGTSIQTRLLRDGAFVFGDGFESGDLGLWSGFHP